MSSAEYLDACFSAVRETLRLCPMEAPTSPSIPAHKALDAVAQRLALGVDRTAVALFGGIGLGKSSLLNVLIQLNFADIGARHPTTPWVATCSWGDGANPLPDSLGVSLERRIWRGSILDGEDQGSMAGLVLLDVPNYDSVTTEHSLQVDRPVPLTDILVQMINPQRYVDAALHDDYLRGLGAHQENMPVLVNQVDTPPGSGLASLLDDVRSFLKDDGPGQVQVLPVPAVRGDNLDVVRSMLHQRVTRESNTARMASAELGVITRHLRPTVARNKVELNVELTEETTKILLRASGARAVEDSVRTGLSRVLSRALARPEPPPCIVVSSVHFTWVHRISQGPSPTWARSLETSIASPKTLAGQTAEAVDSAALPGHRQLLIDLLWWGDLLIVLGGVSWLTTFMVREGLKVPHRNTEITPVCLVAVELLALLTATVHRRGKACRETQRYGQRVRDRLESVVERGLSRSAGKILDRYRVLQSALGFQPICVRQPCGHSPEPAPRRDRGGG